MTNDVLRWLTWIPAWIALIVFQLAIAHNQFWLGFDVAMLIMYALNAYEAYRRERQDDDVFHE